MSKKFIPVGGRLLVKLKDESNTTNSGIILKTTESKDRSEGTVVELGEGFLAADGTRIPFEVSKGSRIIFSRYAGVEVDFEEEKYIVLFENDILGYIKES